MEHVQIGQGGDNEKEISIMNNYGRKINFTQLRYVQFKCKINAQNSGPNENKEGKSTSILIFKNKCQKQDTTSTS